MKLLVCTRYRQIVGGVETYLRAILPRLCGLGWRIHLLVEHDDGGGPTIDQDAELERTWALTKTNRAEVAREIRQDHFDVVFNNGIDDTDFEQQLTRDPVVCFAHNYVGACVSGFKRHAWPTPRPCQRTLGLGCLACYFPRRCGGLNPLTMWKNYRHALKQLAMLRACRRIVVASAAMRAEYLRHGLAPERVVLNPLFPATCQADPEPPAPRPMSGVVFLAGRLTEVKGGAYLVRALHLARQSEDCPPLRLAVAGDGPELLRLRALARELAAPTEFHGWLNGAALHARLRSADLLAMPSLWPEPFGLLGVEAGCFGVPSVGYAQGGIPDWLADGKSGALAPSPPTVEGLAQAIVRAVRDPQHHQRLRFGAWEMAQRFRVEEHVRRLDEVFRSVACPAARSEGAACP